VAQGLTTGEALAYAVLVLPGLIIAALVVRYLTDRR